MEDGLTGSSDNAAVDSVLDSSVNLTDTSTTAASSPAGTAPVTPTSKTYTEDELQLHIGNIRSTYDQQMSQMQQQLEANQREVFERNLAAQGMDDSDIAKARQIYELRKQAAEGQQVMKVNQALMGLIGQQRMVDQLSTKYGVPKEVLVGAKDPYDAYERALAHLKTSKANSTRKTNVDNGVGTGPSLSLDKMTPLQKIAFGLRKQAQGG